MKTFFHIVAGLGAALVLLALLSCAKASAPVTVRQNTEEEPKEESNMPDKIQITIDGTTLPIVLVKNAATEALVSALREAPITYTASDYGGFEKVGALGLSLPATDTHITTEAGDVILYSGNQIVLFYGSNSWSYTRIGKMEYESLDALRSFLKAGEGNIRVTLSL